MNDLAPSQKPRKVSFWKLGLGLLLLVLGLNNLGPNGLAQVTPGDAAENLGFYTVTATAIIAGLGLIIVGAKSLWSRTDR